MRKKKKKTFYIDDYKVRIYTNGVCEDEIFYNALPPKNFLDLVNNIITSFMNTDNSSLNGIDTMIEEFKYVYCLG